VSFVAGGEHRLRLTRTARACIRFYIWCLF